MLNQAQSTTIAEKLPDAQARKTALTVSNRISDTPQAVNESQKQQEKFANDPLTPSVGDAAYPTSIEKMSERWRQIQKEEQHAEDQQPRKFVEKNYLTLGLGIALLIIALIVVFGGLAFLIMRAR